MMPSTLELGRAKEDIAGTISRYIKLTKKGDEFVACCPFHDEHTPSFTVTPATGYFYCFGCGEGGDAIDFVQKYEGVGFNAAVGQIVGNHTGEASPVRHQPKPAKAADEWKLISPIPEDTTPPKFTFRGMQATRTWLYRDEAGGRIGYVCRFDKPEGGKDVVPLAYWVNTSTGEMAWRFAAFPKPRPIYGLDRLAANPTAQVLIVEGEKAADAAQKLFGSRLVVVSWPGGGKAVRYVDWSPLKGRRVGLWPDADQKTYPEKHELAGELMPFIEQPGTVAMVDVAEALEGLAESVRFITPPQGVPDGWDLADDLPEGFNLMAHAKSSALPMVEFLANHDLSASPVAISEPAQPAASSVAVVEMTEAKKDNDAIEEQAGDLDSDSREKSGIAGGWESKLPDVRMTRNGPLPLNTAANLRAVCQTMGWRPCMNEMDGEYEVLTEGGEQLGGSLEGQYSAMVSTTQRLGLSKDAINDHLPALCREASYHPVRRWLHGREWDGVPRVDAVIATLNAKDPAFARSVMVPWLIGCIACLYEPTFSSKLVPVLQGDQSLRKSAWVSRVAGAVPSAYFDGDLNPKDRDSVKRAVSRWIFELAELESTTKRENGHLKAFLSSATDRFRSPYARTDTVKRRQTNFIGTVNGDGFLKDPTGSTRYAVIEMAGRADMEVLNELLGWSYNEGRIRLDREDSLRQFWLEVKAKYDAGETWMLSEHTLQMAAAVNDNFTDKGSVYEFLMDYHIGKNWSDSRWLTAADVVQIHGGNPAMAREYGKALRRMASEGVIEMKEGRSRRVEYLLKYNRHDRLVLDEGSPI